MVTTPYGLKNAARLCKPTIPASIATSKRVEWSCFPRFADRFFLSFHLHKTQHSPDNTTLFTQAPDTDKSKYFQMYQRVKIIEYKVKNARRVFLYNLNAVSWTWFFEAFWKLLWVKVISECYLLQPHGMSENQNFYTCNTNSLCSSWNTLIARSTWYLNIKII